MPWRSCGLDGVVAENSERYALIGTWWHLNLFHAAPLLRKRSACRFSSVQRHATVWVYALWGCKKYKFHTWRWTFFTLFESGWLNQKHGDWGSFVACQILLSESIICLITIALCGLQVCEHTSRIAVTDPNIVCAQQNLESGSRANKTFRDDFKHTLPCFWTTDDQLLEFCLLILASVAETWSHPSCKIKLSVAAGACRLAEHSAFFNLYSVSLGIASYFAWCWIYA